MVSVDPLDTGVNNNDWRLDLNDAMNPVLAFIE